MLCVECNHETLIGLCTVRTAAARVDGLTVERTGDTEMIALGTVTNTGLLTVIARSIATTGEALTVVSRMRTGTGRQRTDARSAVTWTGNVLETIGLGSRRTARVRTAKAKCRIAAWRQPRPRRRSQTTSWSASFGLCGTISAGLKRRHQETTHRRMPWSRC